MRISGNNECQEVQTLTSTRPESVALAGLAHSQREYIRFPTKWIRCDWAKWTSGIISLPEFWRTSRSTISPVVRTYFLKKFRRTRYQVSRPLGRWHKTSSSESSFRCIWPQFPCFAKTELILGKFCRNLWKIEYMRFTQCFVVVAFLDLRRILSAWLIPSCNMDSSLGYTTWIQKAAITAHWYSFKAQFDNRNLFYLKKCHCQPSHKFCEKLIVNTYLE